jgi:hypothetical protein
MDRTAPTEPQCLYKGALYLNLRFNTQVKDLLLMIYIVPSCAPPRRVTLAEQMPFEDQRKSAFRNAGINHGLFPQLYVMSCLASLKRVLSISQRYGCFHYGAQCLTVTVTQKGPYCCMMWFCKVQLRGPRWHSG